MQTIVWLSILGGFLCILHSHWVNFRLFNKNKKLREDIEALDAELISASAQLKETDLIKNHLLKEIDDRQTLLKEAGDKLRSTQEVPKENLLEAIKILNESLIIIMNINGFASDDDMGKMLQAKMLTLLQNTEKSLAKINRTLVDMRGGDANTNPNNITEAPKLVPAKPSPSNIPPETGG